jgi:altronate dehydratase
MSAALPFEQVGRLPASGDNVAIAVRRLEAGSVIEHGGRQLSLPVTILEGHRFAMDRIAADSPLLSWGLPFGFALREIAPGEYICNEKILRVLRQRHVDFAIPSEANFRDYYIPFQFDESKFRPGRQVDLYPTQGTFEGYARDGDRGVGTRNFIAILGTSSRTASYARALAERFKHVPEEHRNIDGVVAIAHTEGGGEGKPNNIEFTLRTLAGFMVHPNIGAVLAVDLGIEYINNGSLREFMVKQGYQLDRVLHQFFSLRTGFLPGLNEGEKIVGSWLEPVNGFVRSAQPLKHLRIGLQCGGSDAFSGVSGNPLVGLVTKELVRHGGSANLAETDELIGAEPYILANMKELATARSFLDKIARFQERAGWHGHNGEGNPSGGNNFRGLYNIAIKSIGAARKKDPEVQIDRVIDYAAPMRASGFYFMDSPGNDLESIAGQVGSGCNLILFTTGNGSITNFPFVPTVKVMTNSGRFNLLSREMDVNAGKYLDGTPIERLGREAFELTVRVASGERTAGEKAGHSQVQLWRDWRQTDGNRLNELLRAPRPNGEPIRLRANSAGAEPNLKFEMFDTGNGPVSEQVGLIVPTSLCAGQIGKMIAEKLNRLHPRSGTTVSRYVALAHTEGCGASSGESEEIFLRTMAAYLCHPLVGRALLLEHGCEKTHNDAIREFFEQHGIDFSRFGMASVQLDGGIEKVTAKVVDWFSAEHREKGERVMTDLGSVRLGLMAEPNTPEALMKACVALVGRIVHFGGTVVIPENGGLPDNGLAALLEMDSTLQPTLGYGERCMKPGLHIMQCPTDHSVETLTGLGATGVEVMLATVSKTVWQSHPLVPLIQVSSTALSNDVDLMVSSRDSEQIACELLPLIVRVLRREYLPKLFVQGNTEFQMTRGLLGVSL